MKRARVGRFLLPILFNSVGLLAGCGSEPEPGPDVTDPATGSSTTTTTTTTAPPSTPPADGQPPTVDPTMPTGFPCDVHAVLQSNCAGCHAGRLYSGPNFDSRDDLFHQVTDLFLVARPGILPGTLGEHIATALRDATMPPYGAVVRPSAVEKELVIAWVTAGMPAGDCGTLTPPR